MRILLVSHPPLEVRFGAAQLTLGLAEGLRSLGHDVVTWSATRELEAAGEEPGERARNRVLARWLRHGPGFDVIDVPAIDASFLPSSEAVIVARSVQPELLYAEAESLAALRRHPLRFSTWRQLLLLPGRRARVIRGWRRSSLILCLGSLESAWMRRVYPELSGRVSSYVAAPLPARRLAALDLRSRRERRASRRALWIGRWSAQKGTDTLVSWLTSIPGSSKDWMVTLAGCGRPDDPALADLVASGRVAVRPEFEDSDWIRLLDEHDAGLFTSRVEGWGLGVQEMLEAGLPVFATRVGAVPDLEPHFPSQLRPFPPTSPPPDLEPHREPMRREYLETFDWVSIARQYVDDVRASSRAV